MSKERCGYIFAGGRCIAVVVALTAWLLCAKFSTAQTAGTGALSGVVSDRR